MNLCFDLKLTQNEPDICHWSHNLEGIQMLADHTKTDHTCRATSVMPVSLPVMVWSAQQTGSVTKSHVCF